ncbi:MAG: pyridoxal phosphate-dependent aminotransferase [Lachnospiraceae bacterium]|nr:pyridoxal phosphate-dependent aminotransferase [Lachnospiraceae bacterium]
MSSVNGKMAELGNVRSAIRDLFEYGLRRKAEIGTDKVFDFSLGNPSVPAPDEVNETIRTLLDTEDSVSLHGYTSAVGAADVRKKISGDIRERFGCNVMPDDLYMTCGAAASLTIVLKALYNPGDEYVAIAPFFPEYRVFSEAAGALFKVVPADTVSFQVDLKALEETITERTKLLILNSPNNPSGVILKRDLLEKLTGLLRKIEERYGHPIYLVADEPYRELVYDGIEVPYLPNLYDDSIVCYSFSKSLSLPGERIGYIAVPKTVRDHDDVFAAVAGAGRALGYVCAPSLMQRVAANCLGKTADIGIYRKNRDLLYNGLTSFGYECVYPDGAFYLFVKSPEPDAKAFAERAKQYELLLVPSDSFGCTGYVRLAYCVSTEMIERSLPAFRKLIESYR